jgi:hypothetical protein
MKPTRYVWLVSLGLCTCGYAGDASTNQPRAQATLVIASVKDGRPVVTVEGRYALRAAVPDGEVVRQWRTNYTLFSKALVEAAEKQHLNSASLAAILRRLPAAPENEHLALLPMMVGSTKFRGQWAWDITLQWEGERYAIEKGRLGHVRDFIISQETLKQLDFKTCD